MIIAANGLPRRELAVKLFCAENVFPSCSPSLSKSDRFQERRVSPPSPRSVVIVACVTETHCDQCQHIPYVGLQMQQLQLLSDKRAEQEMQAMRPHNANDSTQSSIAVDSFHNDADQSGTIGAKNADHGEFTLAFVLADENCTNMFNQTMIQDTATKGSRGE